MAVVRLLRPAPSAFADAHTRRPAFGAFAGPLPRVAFAGRTVWLDVVRRKRWLWACIAADDLLVAFAVVRTGYAASAFVSITDTRAGAAVADGAWTGPPALARVTDDVHAPGVIARFVAPRVFVEVARTSPSAGLEVRLRVKRLGLELDAVLAEDPAPTPLAVIADLGDSDLDATEKRSLLPVRGHVRIGPRRIMLDGGVAGYDYTQGLLPRHTRWRWAYGLGKTERGDGLAFNLTRGFVGEAECAVFDRAGVHGVAEPEITFDAADPRAPWTIRGPGVDLVFRVAHVHREVRRLGVVRTDFLQPSGVFDGTLEVAGKVHVVRRMPGVVEDQDVLW